MFHLRLAGQHLVCLSTPDTMTGDLRRFFWKSLLVVVCARGDGQQEAIDTYYAFEGQFYQLECDLDSRRLDSNQTITWSRDENHVIEEGRNRVETGKHFLRFLPVKPSDSGLYTCSSGTTETRMNLSVATGQCPTQIAKKVLQKGTTGKLSCRQENIFAIDQNAEINWLKECIKTDFHEKVLRLSNISESHAGKYTCQIHFTYKERRYTASETVLLEVKNVPILLKPKLIYPRNETIQVEPGSKTEVNCTGLTGTSEQGTDETSIYWIFNNSFTEHYKHLRLVKQDAGMYRSSILIVTEARPEYFNALFHCIITNPMGKDVGVVRLIPASSTSPSTTIGVCLVISVIVVGLVIYFFFKVEIALAFRGLRHSLRERAPDGKLYDAYVSYIPGNSQFSSRVEDFVMKVLPEVLERRYGYKLFIIGRDSLPGEAVHDTIADTVRKCRRMIIVLPSVDPSDQLQLEPVSQDQPGFEQQIGLYDALIKDNLKVILLEFDKNVDYALFPESVRYVKKKQGAIRWRQSEGDPMATPNCHFWKVLRYRMSEPRSRLTNSTTA